MSADKVRFTTYVNMMTKKDGMPIEAVFSESAKVKLNEQIQQARKIVTCYESLEEYRFDISGIKYTAIDPTAVAGTVERFAYDNNEIVLLLDEDFFAKKGVPGLDEEITTQWAERLDRFEIIPRGLIEIRMDQASGVVKAFIERFVGFDMIPKREEEKDDC